MWGRMASCGRLAIGLPGFASIALRATEGDENRQRPDTIRPQDAILPHSAAKPQAVSSQQSALGGGVGKFSRIGDPNPTPSLAQARVRSRLCNSCGMSVRLQSRARKQAGSVILQFPQRAGCTKSSRRAKNMKDSNTKGLPALRSTITDGAAKPEKFVRRQGRRPERPPAARIGCHTKAEASPQKNTEPKYPSADATSLRASRRRDSNP